MRSGNVKNGDRSPEPALELYESDPVRYRGRRVRIQLLVPDDWTVEVRDQGKHVDRLFHPPPSTDAAHPRFGFIHVELGYAPHAGDISLRVCDSDSSPIPFRSAWRGIDRGRGCIQYQDTDFGAFEATYRPICESFRVVG